MGLKIAQHHIDTVRLVGDRGGPSVWIGGALLHTGGRLIRHHYSQLMIPALQLTCSPLCQPALRCFHAL